MQEVLSQPQIPSPHRSIDRVDELTVALLQPLLCHAHPQIIMKVLFVLTSHDELGNTGKKTGFWLEEFAAPYVVITLCTCTHLPLVAPYVVACARRAVCTCTHHHSQHLQHRTLLPCARAPMPLIVLSFLIVPHSVMCVCACASILASRRCHVRTCATYLSSCVHVCLSRAHMCNLPLTMCACVSVAFTVRRVNMCICMSARLMANSSDLTHN